MSELPVEIPVPVLEKKPFLLNRKMLAAGTAAVLAGAAYVVIDRLTAKSAVEPTETVIETPFEQ